MRRFLVIVIFSYFTAYYYLDSTYWTNRNSSLYKSAENPREKEITPKQSQNIYFTSKKPTKPALLTEYWVIKTP